LIGTSSLRKKYDQLRSKGFSDKKARQTLSRDSAAIALSIMKTRKPYDDKYEEKKTRKNKILN